MTDIATVRLHRIAERIRIEADNTGDGVPGQRSILYAIADEVDNMAMTLDTHA